MENVRGAREMTKSLQNLKVNHTSEDRMPNRCIFSVFCSPTLQVQKLKAPSLVNLCLGIVGKHFEDIVEDLADIAANFPSDIKLAMAAIARRRKLLNDKIIIDLAESSWEILDLSGSDVSDFGLAKLALICNRRLRAVDISRCIKITPVGVYEALQHCGKLEVLRWGGCPESDSVARASLCLLKPKLEDMDGDSWEDLDTMEIAPSLRWLIWPNIDKDSMEKLWMECPRIVVNPKPVSSVLGYNRGRGGGGEIIPREAVDDVELDEVFVKDVDPKTWSAIGGGGGGTTGGVGDHKLEEEDDITISVAEKFRLAYLDRDTRLAPKRAKNVRQRQRRAEREAETSSTMAKALVARSNINKKDDDGYWW
ncbi:uncharacterized protein LOC124945815 [Impatiens glandulifera]|uniref:uncharacterized protein LOC124945815 n=1 Tax=Impatiens glandulifera TaxID=253017 RepID=UPI001FB19508|nr:uncharacterized protein LOC124945815 [Impatiens glandulifera]